MSTSQHADSASLYISQSLINQNIDAQPCTDATIFTHDVSLIKNWDIKTVEHLGTCMGSLKQSSGTIGRPGNEVPQIDIETPSMSVVDTASSIRIDIIFPHHLLRPKL